MKIDLGWKPRPSDVLWTQNLFRLLRDGGMWAIPMNGSVWKKDDARKTIVCIKGTAADMFHKLTVCCREFGWKTELKASSEDVQVFLAESAGTGKSISKTSLN